MKKQSNSLDPDITTSQLMALDYHYNYPESELWSDWNRLQAATEFKSGAQFKPGLKLCQHFFRNFWTIKNNRGVSFADCWQDPVLMDQVRTWGKRSMSKLWLSWIRRAVFMAGGLPNSSFYRPHFAKQLCLSSKTQSGRLFDPCAGWGGRLLGTVAAGWHYTACEPNAETYSNLMRLVEFLDIGDSVRLHNIPAETFDFTVARSFDAVLTSPPYFDLEVYSCDSTQSYNQYSTYDTWSQQWLQPLIRSCLASLNSDAISAWNVMNFKNYDLVTAVQQVHTEQGWILSDTMGFDSPLKNIRNIKNRDITYVYRRG
jgi:hypothetical protein